MRIAIVINKWWECEPAIAAMLNANASPPHAPWPTILRSPLPRPTTSSPPIVLPRAVFAYGQKILAEVWCISDLLDDVPNNQSSSSLKAERLPQIFGHGEPPGLVIAVGTASSTVSSPNRNGGVAIGGSVFLHDAHPNGANPSSTWSGPADQLIPSSMPPDLFEKLASFDAGSALLHFLPVRRSPSDSPLVTIGLRDVALGTINVTDYGEYKFKDRETLGAFRAVCCEEQAVSIETTHGLIRLAANDAPFIFLSAITDRFTYFDADVSVGPCSDPQNTAAAYNAGVTLRWMLDHFSSKL